MLRISVILCISICLCFIECSFINPYPRFKTHHVRHDEDTGEPLYLTPYINKGKIDEAKTLAEVSHPEMKNVTAYSGYLTVDKKYNSNLFFWFFRAQHNPEKAPVVLWLQGGPGATSLFGLFQENGPFIINPETKKLSPRKYSWHLNHNIIYIDNPVGTGFSFTDNDKGYATKESDVGQNLYEALHQFFELFPELQKNDFFVTGESYAGKYVPSVCHVIHTRNVKQNQTFLINLKGLAIGNGLSDPLHQMIYGDYLYQLGLIDKNGLDLFHQYEKKGTDFIKKRDFDGAFEIFDSLINGDQTTSGSLFKNLTGFDTYFNYLNPKGTEKADNAMGEFLQRADLRKAIHVGNNTFHGLDGENKVEIHLKKDVMASVAHLVSELLSYYRTVIYNGQLDIIVAYPLTENYLDRLKFKKSDDYKKAVRNVWRVGNEIAGYSKEAGNLVNVLVRNAGHMVPTDQPKWALDLITRLTSGKSFS